MRISQLLALALVAACGQEPPKNTETDDGSPKCDNIMQDSEAPVKDGVFDADGDGYVDANTPDCVAHYASSSLDCDDTDPTVHPNADEVTCNGIDDDCDAATDDDEDVDNDGVSTCEGDCDDQDGTRSPALTEVCWDGLDNNCDSDIDENCGENYNGRFAITPPVQYQCSLMLVNIDFYAVDVIYIPPYLLISAVGPGGQPGSMDGEMLSGDTSFDVRNWLLLATPVACDEYYMMVGSFIDVDHMEFNFDFWYDGPAFGCLNCSQEGFSIPMTGVRVADDWTPAATTGTGTTGTTTGTGTGTAVGTGTGTGTATATGTGTGTGTGTTTGTGTGTGTTP